MTNDMICPKCGELGFKRAAVYVSNGSLKCEKCGEWSNENMWEPLLTWREYRAEIERLEEGRRMWMETAEEAARQKLAACQAATLAERERCANVAENHKADYWDDHAGQDIAANIRKGGDI